MANVTVNPTQDLGVNPTSWDEIIKLGDLPEDTREKLADAITFVAEHQSEMFNEVSTVPLDASQSSVTFMREYLSVVDKNSDRYKHGLVEGVTPTPEQLNESYYTVSVQDIGWYYLFTDKAKKHAFHDIVTRASKHLSNIFKTYHDEKIADAYMLGANTLTEKVNIFDFDELAQLKTILMKNDVMPFEDGYYRMRVPVEAQAGLASAYKDLFVDEKHNDIVIKGNLGVVNGIRFIASNLRAFKDGENFRFCLYGKTQKGEYPVVRVSYDNLKQNVIYTPLGGLGEDPLKQRGSIGLKLDGHGFFPLNDEACINGWLDMTNIKAVTKRYETVADEAKRYGHTASYVSPSGLYPVVSNLTMVVEDTFTLTVNDVDQEAISASALTFSSVNPKIATVNASGQITAVAPGVTPIYVINKSDTTKMTFVTITVFAKQTAPTEESEG